MQKRFGVGRRQGAGFFLIARAEVPIHGGNLGEDDEPPRVELTREQRRGAVLVDDSIDAREAISTSHDRNATSPAGDDDCRLRQLADHLELDDLQRLWRRDNSAMSPVRIGYEGPAAFSSELFSLFGRVERADRL